MPRLLSAALCLTVAAPVAAQEPLQTVAERTGYRATSRSADVTAFCQQLAARSPVVRWTDFGASGEGRKLHLLTLGDPPADGPDKAAGTPVVLAFANIHAGEVDGKEAVLALARDLAADPAVLKKVTVLIVPDLNPDGNEKVDPAHRPDQNGPRDGVGTRENAGGLDLNRDFVKLESPEVRALVKLVARWNPAVAVDCHTTNGSYHRYPLTYDGPRHPAADPRLVAFGQGKLLPDVCRRVKAATGFDTFPYGNFSRDRARWETYPAQPRFGVQYLALRGTVGLLSESYTYAPFADRVKASYGFVKAAVEAAADHAEELKKVAAEAAGPRGRVALRTRPAAAETAAVLGYEEVVKDGKRARTDVPKEYPVTLATRVEPTLEVGVPAAYLVPPGFPAAVEALQRHGVRLDELREDVEVDAERYLVTDLRRADRPFQGHRLVTLEAKPEKARVTAPAGGVVVRTSQPLGTLAAYLLEPQAEDGLAAWNFFDKGLTPGGPFPVLRLLAAPDAMTGPAAPLPEDRPAPKPVTLDVLLGRGGLDAHGEAPAGPVEWLPDGEHYLQPRQGKLLRIHARTGRAEPFVDPDKLRQSLQAVKGLDAKAADRLVRAPSYRMNPARTATLVDAGADLAVAYFDGAPAARLGTGAGREFVTFSPAGDRVAFVRGGNLFTVDVRSQAEARLTADGGGDVLNGKADWVYEEEIFNRNGKAYWWSPDGSRIAFLRFDDAPVAKFPIADPFPAPRGRLESIPYPKTGDPNPLVRLCVAPAAGGPARALDLSGYKPEDTVVSRVGWVPNSNTVFAYVQNREQTWLDFVTWPDPAGAPVKLFRETTGAWVEDLGEPKFLPDGSVLVLSERDGWKHLYHYRPDGTLVGRLTRGEWEVQAVERADPDGTVFVTGTKDGHTRTHLYRVPAGGGEPTRLTPAGGTHQVRLAPTGPLFVDRFSDTDAPPKAALFEAGGGKVRDLDTNPARDMGRFKLGKHERVQVPMKDGFVLEGALTYPPDFDPGKRYPVWVRTYAGPHAPTVRDGWSPRLFEHVLAASGIVVFAVDPRSASGKGAVSAWTCYKRLGVGELKDLEEAVDRVCRNPWADAGRVGLSGHSYGGFMTAYALTHSRKFAAGIAGAPVTDWRLYDTIYTERYMGLPDANKAGYDASSVVKAAANLHGKLLLVHGMVDDNVHLQNTAQLADALQRAEKPFEVMVYPRARHGVGGPHYQRLQVEFIRRALGVDNR